MAQRPLTKPRKQASQERSRATVEALVEATARILVRDGFDKASTNRIGQEAGVSIGSLYQYFPSKEALVVALIQRHNRQLMAVVYAALDEVEVEDCRWSPCFDCGVCDQMGTEIQVGPTDGPILPIVGVS